MMKRQYVIHEFDFFCPEDADCLILGSIPSPKSREMGFYYGHPQNRFWKVLAGVYSETVPNSIDEKKKFLSCHRIALWDVLYACTIEGASDASIQSPVPNDLTRIFEKAPITKICTTGKKAFQLFQKIWGNTLAVPVYDLPSTSPANCRVSLETLIQVYSKVLCQL